MRLAGWQVAGLRNLPELPVVPGIHPGSWGSAFNQKGPKLGADAGPHHAWEPTKRWQPPLKHFVEHVVVAAEHVFQLGGGKATAGGGDVGGRPREQQPPVHLLQRGKQRVHHGRHGVGQVEAGRGLARRPQPRPLQRQPHVQRQCTAAQQTQGVLELRGRQRARVVLQALLQQRRQIGRRQRTHLHLRRVRVFGLQRREHAVLRFGQAGHQQRHVGRQRGRQPAQRTSAVLVRQLVQGVQQQQQRPRLGGQRQRLVPHGTEIWHGGRLHRPRPQVRLPVHCTNLLGQRHQQRPVRSSAASVNRFSLPTLLLDIPVNTPHRGGVGGGSQKTQHAHAAPLTAQAQCRLGHDGCLAAARFPLHNYRLLLCRRHRRVNLVQNFGAALEVVAAVAAQTGVLCHLDVERIIT
eukprot:m.288203 g.288203  ORF g.288203 m.288203 type:complete len:406 (+) comp22933_c0_seq1:2412-3629(+)